MNCRQILVLLFNLPMLFCRVRSSSCWL